MKKHHLAILLTLVCSIAGGQTMVDVRTQTKNVDFSGAASTIPAKSGATVPTSCKLGEMFFNTSNAPGQNLYLCAPANTWTVLAGGGSGSTGGTVLSGANGQFAFYAAGGSTVSGHTLVPSDIPALPYQGLLTFTGNGANTASSTGSITANDCVKWDANGNIVDAGAPCGTGSGSGGGAATFSALTGGTNTSAALVIGSGATLTANGTGLIAATSVPASGVTGLAPSATTDTTNAGNISSGTLSPSRLPSKLSAANGGVIAATTAQVLQSSSHVAFGDSITAGYLASGVGGTTVLADAYDSLLATSENATLSPDGVSGSQACDVSYNKVAQIVTSTVDNNPIYTLMIGTNDANVKGTGIYETNVFQPCHKAAISWIAIANKFSADTAHNCTASGSWVANTGYTFNGVVSHTNGNTLTCPITTYGAPIYFWYTSSDSSPGTFTYAVDGGATTSVSTQSSPLIATSNGGSIGLMVVRIPASGSTTSPVTHSIVFTVTSATSNSNLVSIQAVGTPLPQQTWGMPRVFVGGVPKQQANANATTTSAYDADVQADVALLAGDGLGVYYVPVRDYLCMQLVGGSCANAQGVLDMNTLAVDTQGLHPNLQGHIDLKQAFADTMQFTPYSSGSSSGTVNSATSGQFAYYSATGTAVGGHTLVAGDIPALPYDASGAAAAITLGTLGLTWSGNTTKAASTTGTHTSGNCASWDANGNIVDNGAACGSGGGGGSSTIASTTDLIAGSGSGNGVDSGIAPTSVVTLSGTQTLTNKSISSAQITGLAASATTDTTNASNITSGALPDAQLPTDQCVLKGYSISFTNLAALTPITAPVYTIPGLSLAANQDICYIYIRATTGFAAASSTVAQVRLQSSGNVVFSPNQDLSTVAANNFWKDAGAVADRNNAGVQAAFTFTGATAAASAGSVNIVIGVRTMPTGF